MEHWLLKCQLSSTVFSRPLFYLGDIPPIEEEDVRGDILVRLSAKPLVFKFLLEGYPGANEIIARRAQEVSSLVAPPSFKTSKKRDILYNYTGGTDTILDLVCKLNFCRSDRIRSYPFFRNYLQIFANREKQSSNI